jgi:hypothetical protein
MNVRPYGGRGAAVGFALSVALHAMLLAWLAGFVSPHKPARQVPPLAVVQLKLLSPPAEVRAPELAAPAPAPAPRKPPPPAHSAPEIPVVTVLETPQPTASMPAPPAPTAEEWAFAGQYTLKNSKAYRYTWGQQVRSMMGTAVEGPDQGMVRFRVEIAPDGALSRLDTLWSTSPVAERLARQAIGAMTRWPATPTGKPLVFEKTIMFTPFASEGPPLYKDDCLPDPPAFANPFAWDGGSAPAAAAARPIERADPQALEDCLRQLPRDSIEAELAHDQRTMERWGSSKLGR